MTKLIPKENRIAELISFGLPEIFIENIGKIPELKYKVEDVESAYFYLPTILHYEVLKGKTIVPIYSCGESFYVLVYDNKSKNIIHFELENDRIYTDYGTNYELLLMDIMIEYFDDNIDDELEIEDFISVGNKIGFTKAETLYRLRNLSIDDYNEKFENNKKWRLEIAQQLNIF